MRQPNGRGRNNRQATPKLSVACQSAVELRSPCCVLSSALARGDSRRIAVTAASTARHQLSVFAMKEPSNRGCRDQGNDAAPIDCPVSRSSDRRRSAGDGESAKASHQYENYGYQEQKVIEHYRL